LLLARIHHSSNEIALNHWATGRERNCQPCIVFLLPIVNIHAAAESVPHRLCCLINFDTARRPADGGNRPYVLSSERLVAQQSWLSAEGAVRSILEDFAADLFCMA
jgi:hypothetical protein